MTDLSTLTIGDRMRLCPHENIVPHPAPDLVYSLVEPQRGPHSRVVRKIPRTYAMQVRRCLDCDKRWEAR